MYKERINRVLDLLREGGIEQAIVSSTASVYYLTGLWIETHERMLALLISSSGEATLYTNAVFGVFEEYGVPVFLHTDNENPVAQLASALKPGKVGIDKFWYSKFLLELMDLRRDVVPVDGSYAVDIARRTKGKDECELMRKSSKINDEVMAKALAAITGGMSENELAVFIKREHLKRGADGGGTELICFGANGADPHHMPDETALSPGDSVVMDVFTPIDRYWCDMTRTVFYKTVSARQREVYELVRRANEAAIRAVRPGVKLSEIDGIARKIITDGGYGEFFTHRLGHGCGLECHEPPDVSGACDELLLPGMVHSVEPGIYLPEEFGVRIEDLVLVTETGCEVLNSYPKDLIIIE